MYQTRTQTTHGTDEHSAQQTFGGALLAAALPLAALAGLAAPALAGAAALLLATSALAWTGLERSQPAPDNGAPPTADRETASSTRRAGAPADD